MTLHPYDNSYHRYFNMYEKNGTRIYELGCINCPPLKCVCTKREIIGAKIPYTVRISGNFKRIAILNLEPAFLTPINIGKFKNLSSYSSVHTGLSIFCLCKLNALARSGYIKNPEVHLSTDNGHRILPAGACMISGTSFAIHYHPKNFPSLSSLCRLQIIKIFHSQSAIKNLAKEGFMPETFLGDFPQIIHAARGFFHQMRKGKHTIRFSTCDHMPNHSPNSYDGPKDCIIF